MSTQSVITTDVFNTTLTLNFSNGKELQLDVATLPQEMLMQAALHGMKQKLADAAAIKRDTVTGRSATVEDKFDAVKTVFDRITGQNPSWNAIREGVERATGGMFIRALMELTKKPKEVIDAQIGAYSKEQIAELKKNPKIVAIMQRMELEKAQATNDSEAILSELMG
jgi:hypothetical protein